MSYNLYDKYYFQNQLLYVVYDKQSIKGLNIHNLHSNC
jgi:hypothetical protein